MKHVVPADAIWHAPVQHGSEAALQAAPEAKVHDVVQQGVSSSQSSPASRTLLPQKLSWWIERQVACRLERCALIEAQLQVEKSRWLADVPSTAMENMMLRSAKLAGAQEVESSCPDPMEWPSSCVKTSFHWTLGSRAPSKVSALVRATLV